MNAATDETISPERFITRAIAAAAARAPPPKKMNAMSEIKAAGGVRLRLRLSNIFHFESSEIGLSLCSPLSFLTRGIRYRRFCQSPRVHLSRREKYDVTL